MGQNLTGYNGKIAYINLTTEKIEYKDLDPQIAKDYIGGAGLSAKLIFDLLKEEDYQTLKKNPFSEVNPIVFATGPLTGTPMHSSGRYSVSGISPLTHIWGEGTSGGHFCISLRKSGFDALVITGKAKNPIYIYIKDGNIELKDANKLWNKNTYETQEFIKKEINEKGIRVACIGIAGENLVKYAAIMNDEGRAVGRCGLGALMGSKKLKAIAIRGFNKIGGQDYGGIKKIRKAIEEADRIDVNRTMNDYVRNLYGTNSYLDIGINYGDIPGYYFTETEFLAEKLTQKTLSEKYPTFITGCSGCTLKCAKKTVIDDNGKKITIDGPEYESMSSLGTLCGTFEPKPVILAHHKCNVHGIDTISCGVCIAFLIYLVENNINSNKIKDYLKEINIEDIKWGNGELILQLIVKIASREDIGDLLAEGVKIIADKLGVDPNLAAHVKGLEIPMHDPRAYAGVALNYITSCIGPSHEKGDWHNMEMGMFQFPRFDIKPCKFDITGHEGGVIALQNLRAFEDSAIYCNFKTAPRISQIAKLITFATGIKYRVKDIFKCGERINQLKRLISCKMGLTRKDDSLPSHVLKVLKTGATAGVTYDLEDNLKSYYKIRNWDWKTGLPKNEKLKELGII